VPTADGLEAGKTPIPRDEDARTRAAREILARVVRAHALDPTDAWAMGHGLLALGGEAALPDGTPVVDHLFNRFAERSADGTVGFPATHQGRPVEPHEDLVLKMITEVGVAPDRAVTVAGAASTPAALYRDALARTWVDGDRTSYESWNDVGWSLQGLATWAPPDLLSWTARGGHETSLDALATAALDVLRRESASLRRAKAAGETPSRTAMGRAGNLGLLGYTCGGAHLLQGVAYAAGRGFVPEDRRGELAEEAGLYLWRLSWEIPELDAFRKRFPELGPKLVVQRLKFLGHLVETLHKMAIQGLFTPDRAQRKTMNRAVDELIGTVVGLEASGWFRGLDALRREAKPRFPGVTTNEQIYLDTVGDAAHALRGLDLATGRATLLH